MAQEKKPKLLLIILILLIVLEAAFIVVLSIQKAAETKEKLNLKLQLKGTSDQLSTKEAQAKELEAKIAELEKVKGELKAQIDEFTIQQKIIEAKIQASKEVVGAFTQQFQRQQEDAFQKLKSFSTESRKTQMVLIAKIESLIEARRSLEDQLVKVKEAQQQETEEDGDNPPEVPLGTINIQMKPQGKPVLAQPLPTPKEDTLFGTILSVDNDYNFAIVDLGRDSGIKVKDKLLVLRQDKKIGEAEVKEMYRNMSLIDIIPDKTQGKLRKHDKVVPFAAPSP